MAAIAERHPVAVAAYFAAGAGLAMFSRDPVVVGLSLVGAVGLTALVGGLRPGRFHLWALLLFAAMAIINPLTYHDGATVLLVVSHNPITWEACLYGIVSGGMIVAALYWFRSFSRIMTSDRLLVLFGGLSPRLALVISMALRYVPLFGAQARKVHQTQRALGLYRDDNPMDGLRGRMREFSILTTWALENGVITADSMAARGYGLGRRSHFRLLPFTWADGAWLALSLALAALSLWGLSDRAVTFYPVFIQSPLTGRALAGYLAYGGLLLEPYLMEAKEAMAWHTWRWRR